MQNFIKALGMLDDPIPKPIFFRLYYNKETGEPITYSMEELEGDYIDITKLEYAECRYDIKVKDGKIQKISGISIGKLVPCSWGSDTGQRTSPYDVSIIDEDSIVRWKMKTYD